MRFASRTGREAGKETVPEAQGQVMTERVSTEDELKRIGAAWAKLPQNIRLAILALVAPFRERETEAPKE
jgi:hypothetical protein